MKQDDVNTVMSLLVLALFALGVALMVGSSFKMTGAFLAVFFGMFSYLAWFRRGSR